MGMGVNHLLNHECITCKGNPSEYKTSVQHLIIIGGKFMQKFVQSLLFPTLQLLRYIFTVFDINILLQYTVEKCKNRKIERQTSVQTPVWLFIRGRLKLRTISLLSLLSSAWGDNLTLPVSRISLTSISNLMLNVGIVMPSIFKFMLKIRHCFVFVFKGLFGSFSSLAIISACRLKSLIELTHQSIK